MTITREDLHPDYVTPQTTHSVADFAAEFPTQFLEWKNDTNSIINLSVKNEEELLHLYEKFESLTPTIKFYEPDVDEYTSIALMGYPDIRKKLSSLPLLRVTKIIKQLQEVI